MPKVFNLKQDEEITSVIERLWETGAEEVFFVAPKGSALTKNIIGLKLLKREADRLGKEIALISKDEVAREMAKRAGLATKAILPKSAEDEDEPSEDTLHELPQKKFEALLREQIMAKRQPQVPGRPVSMSDIRVKKKVHDYETPLVFDEEKEEPEPIKEHSESMEFAKTQFLAGAQESQEVQEETFLAPEDFLGAREPSPAFESFFEPRPVPAKKPAWNPLKSLTGFFEKQSLSKPVSYVEKRTRSATAIPHKLFIGFSIAAVLVAFGVLYLILPKAQISLTPKSQASNQDIQILSDKSLNKIDAAQNRMPAQLIRVDKRESGEFAATGQRQLNEKATGKITVYNEYSSSPQALVEKTRFVSAEGKTFRTAKSITVPGAQISEGKIKASSIEVEVVADEPGSDFNIGPGRFTIPGFQGSPKYDSFYGISKAAMSGGASGMAKVVSQEDFDKAKDQLWQALQPSLDQEFKSQIPSGLKMVEGAFKQEVGGVESDVAVGAQGEKFTLTVKGTAAAVLIDENNILQLLQKKLSEKLKESPDFEVRSNGIVYENVEADFFRGILSFKAKVNEKLVWKVDADQIKNEIAGKNESEVKSILSQHEELDQVSVSFWPFWVKNVPANVDKIKMKVLDPQ